MGYPAGWPESFHQAQALASAARKELARVSGVYRAVGGGSPVEIHFDAGDFATNEFDQWRDRPPSCVIWFPASKQSVLAVPGVVE